LHKRFPNQQSEFLIWHDLSFTTIHILKTHWVYITNISNILWNVKKCWMDMKSR